MRMLALAEAWCARSGTFVVAGSVPSAFVPRVAALGGTVIDRPVHEADGPWTTATAQQLRAAAVVADGYSFAADFQRPIVEAGIPLMVVDDNGENAEYLAPLVLNLNVHAADSQYAQRATHTELLLGPRYALIRREIVEAASRAPLGDRRVDRCLMTLGGADPLDLTGRLLRHRGQPSYSWCVLVGGANPRMAAYERLSPAAELVFNTSHFAEYALRCQLAFAGAGGTVWELALLNVPSAVVAVADNQVQLAERLAALGAVEYFGDARAVGSPESWLEGLEALARSPERRRRLIDSARAIVDGSGAERVVQKLLEVV
jgi:spore coat polysaccharide biosynthesis predicted glycosyltransferase SpsG